MHEAMSSFFMVWYLVKHRENFVTVCNKPFESGYGNNTNE